MVFLMQTNDLENLRQLLAAKRKLLLQEIRKTCHDNRSDEVRLSFERVQDNPDRSVDELLKHISSHVLGSRGEELENIENALQKIRRGTYGVCEMCEARIPLSRLRVFPEAVYCVACQTQQEVHDRRSADQTTMPQPPGMESYLDDDE
jgi:DnaK suppressor protein